MSPGEKWPIDLGMYDSTILRLLSISLAFCGPFQNGGGGPLVPQLRRLRTCLSFRILRPFWRKQNEGTEALRYVDEPPRRRYPARTPG